MKAWLHQHYFALLQAFEYFRKEKFSIIINIIVIATIFTISIAIKILSDNILPNIKNQNIQPEFIIFLKTNIDPQTLVKKLKNDLSDITIEVIEKRNALDSLSQNNKIIVDIIDFIGENPLPDVIILKTKNEINHIETVKNQLNSYDFIANYYTNDTINKRTYQLVQFIDKSIAYLQLAMVFLTLFLVFIIIRLSQLHFSRKIQVMLWLGATPRFIRRSFYYQGFIVGILAGVVMLFLVKGIEHLINVILEKITAYYSVSFLYEPVVLDEYILYFAVLLTACWLSALFSAFLFRFRRLSFSL